MLKPDLNILDYKAAVYYGIECFDRGIFIAWDGDTRGAAIYAVADDAYNRWIDVDNNPDLQFICCEEYIIGEIEKLGIQFDYCYAEQEDKE